MRFRPVSSLSPLLLAGGMLLAASLAQAQPSAPASEYRVVCDDTCLRQFADRYLDALANRQPSRVPLAADVRFTENGAELAIGDALWATADALGENRLVFTDPASGGIHLYAAMVENGQPSMLAARLKVEDREITEIETSVLRRNANDAAMASFAVDRPIWSETVPANRRAWEVLERWQKPFLTAFSDGDPITRGLDRPLQQRIPGARGLPHRKLRGGHFLQEDSGPELAQATLELIAGSGGASS